MLEARKVFEF